MLGLAPSGFPLWTANYDGPAGLDDQGLDIAVDSAGHVYVAGFSMDQDGDEAGEWMGSMVLMRFTPDSD